jgi:uncharacterized protein
MKKKIAIIICFLFPLLAGTVSAYYDLGSPKGFVNDYADIINNESEKKLEAKLVEFENNSGNEIAVVTVPELKGDTVENFAAELFSDWGIGKEGNDNGVLILVALDDRKMRIEVGYGLEGALTDAQSWWIIDNVMKPEFRRENYYQGIDMAVDKVISATRGEYVPSREEKEGGWLSFAGNVVMVVFIAMLWVVSVLGRSKSWWLGGVLGGLIGIAVGLLQGFVYAGISALVILVPIGLLFDYIVSRKYQKHKRKGSVPWWIGGGRGGGSGSSGGGFGGFGGGMSGGGGASGSW